MGTTTIRLLTPLCATSPGPRAWKDGAVVQWDADDAKRLIAAGYAEPVEPEKKTNPTQK